MRGPFAEFVENFALPPCCSSCPCPPPPLAEFRMTEPDAAKMFDMKCPMELVAEFRSRGGKVGGSTCFPVINIS